MDRFDLHPVPSIVPLILGTENFGSCLGGWGIKARPLEKRSFLCGMGLLAGLRASVFGLHTQAHTSRRIHTQVASCGCWRHFWQQLVSTSSQGKASFPMAPVFHQRCLGRSQGLVETVRSAGYSADSTDVILICPCGKASVHRALITRVRGIVPCTM